MRSLRPSLIMEHHSVPSISDLAREASLSSTLLRRGRQTYATDSVGGFSLRSRSLMRLRGRVSAKLIRNLSDPDRLSCSLTVWDVYRAATAEEFRHLMNEFQQWCATQTWTASVHEML